ncbi:hypothetical protein ACFBZI_09140 [Moraxella sp. ZJ142]|uniref:hypothetical protein n=1 Tax=Moraxella marmotae TaxID=3344520 RepID=UPI0035D43704
MNQKLLIASVVAALSLTACNKPAPQPADAAQTEQAADAHEHHDHDHDHDHDGHDHDHEGHDHEHHHHHHDEGDAYQCGDKTVHIVVHNHDGRIEAHLTDDGVVYDLDQDPANANRYITDDGIQGDDKAMSLELKDDKAIVAGSDNAVLLDCVKQK